MSKLKDKLTRLHTSRVNAQNTPNTVFEAVATTPKTDRSETPSATKTGASDNSLSTSEPQNNDFVELRRSSKLKQKTRHAKKTAPKTPAVQSQPAHDTAAHSISHPSVGARLTELRTRAQALIDVGALADALPHLFEMVALAPTNPFPLQHLVKHYDAIGNGVLATIYRERLKQVAPY